MFRTEEERVAARAIKAALSEFQGPFIVMYLRSHPHVCQEDFDNLTETTPVSERAPPRSIVPKTQKNFKRHIEWALPPGDRD